MTKKKWIRPECTRIKLVPEEAVLTGCKTHASAGRWNNVCVGGGPSCHQAKS